MSTEQEFELSLGDTVYGEDGSKLGTIRGFDEKGFYVTNSKGVTGPKPRHASTGTLGEADLMWRCWQCGETGRIDEIPEDCPSCGAGGEELYYWTED